LAQTICGIKPGSASTNDQCVSIDGAGNFKLLSSRLIWREKLITVKTGCQHFTVRKWTRQLEAISQVITVAYSVLELEQT
jgi:hypothetical protein